MSKKSEVKQKREATRAMLRRETLAALREKALMAGFKLILFNERHCRIYGKVQVDFWPSTGKAWVVGSIKSFIPNSLEEVIEVAGKEKWPEGAFLKNAPPELLSEYFDPKEICPCCGERIEDFRKSLPKSTFPQWLEER